MKKYLLIKAFIVMFLKFFIKCDYLYVVITPIYGKTQTKKETE